MIKSPYCGAGILFVVMTNKTPEILLGKRRRSCVWTIPGGGRDAGEKGFWSTAARETEEEFCGYCLKSDDDQTPSTQGKTYFYPYGSSQNHTQHRIHYEHLFGFLYPFLLYNWKTFIVKLSAKPPVEEFPNKNACGFRKEFSDAKWFPIDQMPTKTHWLLWPIMWRLKLSRWIKPSPPP